MPIHLAEMSPEQQKIVKCGSERVTGMSPCTSTRYHVTVQLPVPLSRGGGTSQTRAKCPAASSAVSRYRRPSAPPTCRTAVGAASQAWPATPTRARADKQTTRSLHRLSGQPATLTEPAPDLQRRPRPSDDSCPDTADTRPGHQRAQLVTSSGSCY